MTAIPVLNSVILMMPSVYQILQKKYFTNIEVFQL
jgi:hypothetical protein